GVSCDQGHVEIPQLSLAGRVAAVVRTNNPHDAAPNPFPPPLVSGGGRPVLPCGARRSKLLSTAGVQRHLRIGPGVMLSYAHLSHPPAALCWWASSPCCSTVFWAARWSTSQPSAGGVAAGRRREE